MRTIREIILEEMTKSDYINKEQRSFNFSSYINKLIDIISEENDIKKSLTLTILVEYAIKNLADENIEEIIKNSFIKE